MYTESGMPSSNIVYPDYINKMFDVRPSPEAEKLALEYGYMPYMIERYFRFLGFEETLMLLEANEKPLRKSIRCNDYLIECNELSKRLSAKGIHIEKIPWLPHGYWVIREKFPIGATREYLKGYYYIQRPAAMLPVYALNPRPGDTVIDLAAAPGGKTTQIAQLMRDKGLVIAIDISEKRLKALRNHVKRMGFTSVITVRADATKHIGPLKSFANKILLDAPCTGEGLIRIDKSRKRSRSLKDLKYMYYKQVRMLYTALDYLVEHGEIVYSTCSIAPEENEAVIDTILLNREDVRVEAISLDIGVPGLTSYGDVHFYSKDLRKCRRIYPFHKEDTEGFFLCKLRKNR